jgi:hypothetical protein
MLVAMFVPSGPIIMGIDDTIERRKGQKIKARGIYRDPVRSSHGHFVKVSGLRWLVMMLLGERTVDICTGVAVWYHTGLPVVPIRWVLVRDPNGKFEPQALLSTNPQYQPKQILEWFVRRWQMEVTFQEVRKHLGMETQRQWSDLAIARTTPVLLGLFSLVTILAHHLQAHYSWKTRQTIWYSKSLPTFSDALALVRRFFWAATFSTSSESTEIVKVPRTLFERLRDIAVYAA